MSGGQSQAAVFGGVHLGSMHRFHWREALQRFFGMLNALLGAVLGHLIYT